MAESKLILKKPWVSWKPKEPDLIKRFKYFSQVSWILTMVFLFAYGYDSHEDFKRNIRDGFTGMLLFLLAFGFMRNKAPIFEVNDLIWKAVSKICLAYCLFLIFLYFMKYEHAVELVQVWATPVSEETLNSSFKAWDIDCSLGTQNWWAKFDMYFYSHLFGWVFHAFYLKDWYMCWCWSLLTGLFFWFTIIRDRGNHFWRLDADFFGVLV
jgi:hypothetical protein